MKGGFSESVVLVMHTDIGMSKSIYYLYEALLLLQVMRLFRLGRVARALHRFLESSFALLLLMLSFYMIVAHWFACIW